MNKKKGKSFLCGVTFLAIIAIELLLCRMILYVVDERGLAAKALAAVWTGPGRAKGSILERWVLVVN